MKRVFLASEGRNDLGGLARDPVYRTKQLGLLEALMRQIQPEGWEIVDAIPWKNVPKYRSGDHAAAETRTVLGAAALALNLDCDVLVVARDRDGYAHRTSDIEKGIAKIPVHFPTVRVAGGVAIETIEAWVLAIGGQRKSETDRDPLASTVAIGIDHTDAMTDHVAEHGLAKIPQDAASLHAWIASVRAALSA